MCPTTPPGPHAHGQIQLAGDIILKTKLMKDAVFYNFQLYAPRFAQVMVMTTTSKPEKQRRPDKAARRLLAKHLDNLSSETRVSNAISISKQLLEALVELSMATQRLIESWRESQPPPKGPNFRIVTQKT